MALLHNRNILAARTTVTQSEATEVTAQTRSLGADNERGLMY
jgi:hypothetical protein